MELLKRFTQGDLEAFETLFRQFQGQVYGWILRIVRDRGIAEDLTVETFWRIYRARARFDPEATFGAWARRIATNLAIDHLRRRRPEQELPEQLPQEDSPDPALQQETREQIQRAFRRLPATLQAAATLALIDIRLRVFLAVRILRKQLDRMCVKP